MKFIRVVFIIAVLIFAKQSFAQLFHKTYGKQSNPAIVFLHGGPGYNSFTFESSTAQRLADEGYYVVVYDQRGCGRSTEVEDSKYTFDEAVADLDNIYQSTGVKKATLVGHSWGGALSLMYAEQHPDKVKNIILVGAPMDYPQTFKAIVKNAREAYTEQGKQHQLKYLDMLETFDKESLQYANYCFMQAMGSGLYSPDSTTEEAKAIKTRVKQSPDIQLASEMTQEPVIGLYNSEHYTTLVLYDKLKSLKKSVPVYGIYGDEDGLFDDTQLNKIGETLEPKNFAVVTGASHSVFIDQQDKFISLLKKYMK